MFTKLVINKVLGDFTTLLSVKCLYFDAIMKSYKVIQAEQSLLSDINESQLFCFALGILIVSQAETIWFKNEYSVSAADAEILGKEMVLPGFQPARYPMLKLVCCTRS